MAERKYPKRGRVDTMQPDPPARSWGELRAADTLLNIAAGKAYQPPCGVPGCRKPGAHRRGDAQLCDDHLSLLAPPVVAAARALIVEGLKSGTVILASQAAQDAWRALVDALDSLVPDERDNVPVQDTGEGQRHP